MKKFTEFICVFLIIQYSYNAEAKRNNSTQDGLEQMSSTADSMDKELTKTSNSIGNLFKNIKNVFKKTSKEMDDDDNSDSLQSCKNQVKEINNKFNIIYDYANNKLKEILNNKNQKTVDSMYNSIAQLQSIWNSITNLQTAEQVSQFLKTHNQFYNSMNKYLNNSNTIQNQYNTKSLNNSNNDIKKLYSQYPKGNNQNVYSQYPKDNNSNVYSQYPKSNNNNVYSQYPKDNNNNVYSQYPKDNNNNVYNPNVYSTSSNNNNKYSVKNLYNNLKNVSNTKQIKQPSKVKSIFTNKNNGKKTLWQRMKAK